MWLAIYTRYLLFIGAIRVIYACIYTCCCTWLLYLIYRALLYLAAMKSATSED